MPVPTIDRPVSALRQRMIEDMAMRGLGSDTQHEYIRFVRSFAAFLGNRPIRQRLRICRHSRRRPPHL
jgi:integrase/recombinase XerD